MTQRGLSLNQLLVLLFISIFYTRIVHTFPASSDVIVEQGENIGKKEEKDYDDNNKPIYEYQLATWPDEYLSENGHSTSHHSDDGVYLYAPQFEDQEVVFPDLSDTEAAIPTWQNPQTTKMPSTPQNDLMATIFPDIHFDEAAAVSDHDDDDIDHSLIGSLDGGVIQKPDLPKPQVEVIEQYQLVHPNCTTEYKLVLSNGMTNYKKIYSKLMPDGKVVTVQEGYDSVPIPGNDPYSNEFQTQFYIADEHGNNVYRVEKHTRRPELPQYLDYKLQLGNF